MNFEQWAVLLLGIMIFGTGIWAFVCIFHDIYVERKNKKNERT